MFEKLELLDHDDAETDEQLFVASACRARLFTAQFTDCIGASGTLIGSLVFVIGGIPSHGAASGNVVTAKDQVYRVPLVRVFNLASKAWFVPELITDTAYRRVNHVAVRVGSDIYVIGGSTSSIPDSYGRAQFGGLAKGMLIVSTTEFTVTSVSVPFDKKAIALGHSATRVGHRIVVIGDGVLAIYDTKKSEVILF